MDIKEETILGTSITRHWYYVTKGRALCALLRGIHVNEVLDVGAGSGVFSRQLLEFGVAKRAVCVDPGYGSDHVEEHHGRPITFVRSVDHVPQKLILMMDVLEHVDDDASLLASFTARMPRDGRVLITVPAFQWLWSGHDVFLEHRRRYTLSEVEYLVRRAGLTVLKSQYFFGALFPIVAALRLRDRIRYSHGRLEARSDLKVLPAWLNATLIRIHDLERVTLFPWNRIAGLSAFCLAGYE